MYLLKFMEKFGSFYSLASMCHSLQKDVIAFLGEKGAKGMPALLNDSFYNFVSRPDGVNLLVVALVRASKDSECLLSREKTNELLENIRDTFSSLPSGLVSSEIEEKLCLIVPSLEAVINNLPFIDILRDNVAFSYNVNKSKNIRNALLDLMEASMSFFSFKYVALPNAMLPPEERISAQKDNKNRVQKAFLQLCNIVTDSSWGIFPGRSLKVKAMYLILESLSNNPELCALLDLEHTPTVPVTAASFGGSDALDFETSSVNMSNLREVLTPDKEVIIKHLRDQIIRSCHAAGVLTKLEKESISRVHGV